MKLGFEEPQSSYSSGSQRTLFLRDEVSEARGWLLAVMRCIEKIGTSEFDIGDVYAFEHHLAMIYPNNHHVKEKIRQQLQLLRERRYLEFTSRGRYRVTQPH